jgi:hypothetical protein
MMNAGGRGLLIVALAVDVAKPVLSKKLFFDVF